MKCFNLHKQQKYQYRQTIKELSNKKLLLVAALSVATTSVFAQTAKFEGASVFGNFSQMTTSTKLTDGADTLDGLGKSATAVSLGGDYGIKLGNKSVALLGVTYNITKPEMLTFNADGDSFEFKQKNAYSIYVAPGYAVTDKALVYGKLSYNKTKVESTGDITGTQSFSGVGYGVGTRIFIDKNLFVNLEWQQINYGSERALDANWKPTATIGSIGIGYKF